MFRALSEGNLAIGKFMEYYTIARIFLLMMEAWEKFARCVPTA